MDIINSIVLIDKNVIKFCNSRSYLKNFEDLNMIYELFWEIDQNKRNGIIHFSFPLKIKTNFQINLET